MKLVAIFTSSPTLSKFCLAEFIAIARATCIDFTVLDNVDWLQNDDGANAFCVFEVRGEDHSRIKEEVSKIARRCIFLRGIYILLQAARNLEALQQWRLDHESEASAAAVTSTTAALPIILGEDEAKFKAADFIYDVETIGKKYTAERKKSIMEFFLAHPLCGSRSTDAPLKRQSATYRFLVFVQHGVEDALPGSQAQWMSSGPILHAFHLVQLCESARSQLLGKYDLKKRPYIGTTSMPPEESFVMANLCGICPGDYVYDPFCGTGSLLVAAAHYGAHTIGTDMDGRAMRNGTRKGAASLQMQQQRRLALSAYSTEEIAVLTPEERLLPSMKSNFKIYGLHPPESVRMNFSAWQAAFRASEQFDAIMTDPPYGLREPRERVVKHSSMSEGGGDSDATSKTPQRSVASYSTDQVVLDLVMFAAEHLREGGCLAFWHPTTFHYTPDELPRHPSLQLEHDLPQRLSLKVVRRLIVMRKVAPVPFPRPTRESCAPTKHPDDLRQLMDVTLLPDNADYMHYRSKLLRKREASNRFRLGQHLQSHNQDACQEGECEAHQKTGDFVKPRRIRNKHGHSDEFGKSATMLQGIIVANREKNIQIRKEKQEASHRTNARMAAVVSMAESSHGDIEKIRPQ